MHLLSLPWRVLATEDAYFADPSYERENFAFLDTVLPEHDGVFVDIGAHQGLFSTYFSQRAGPNGLVYAFEPDPDNLKLLIYNTSHRPGLAPVVIFPVALAEKSYAGKLQCWRSERPLHSAMRQLGTKEASDFEIPIIVRTLDSFQLPEIDFIKMDVEHWEWKVIEGGMETILFYRPQLLIEIHNNETREQIQQFAQENEYNCEHRHACVHGVQARCEYLYLKPR